MLLSVYKFTLEENLLSIGIPDDEGSIMSIGFKSIDDTLSKFFPEVLLELVSQDYINTKTSSAQKNVDILEYQSDSVRSSLNEAILNAATETDQVFGLNPALNVKRVPATKEQLDIKDAGVNEVQITEGLHNSMVSFVRC